jgi:hypothetical protein
VTADNRLKRVTVLLDKVGQHLLVLLQDGCPGDETLWLNFMEVVISSQRRMAKVCKALKARFKEEGGD